MPFTAKSASRSEFSTSIFRFWIDDAVMLVPAPEGFEGAYRFEALGRLRPSIDPELMIRMLLIGYCYGIRSERRLCEELHLNLAYRWFCQLGLEDKIPYHSTFSKNRHDRFRESETFRHVFETVLRRCITEA